jgi:hypothetical protein
MNTTGQWKQTLLGMIVCSTVFVVGLAEFSWPAEMNRFLVSYGGTAGYQLPLWVNKELGLAKNTASIWKLF